MGVYSEWFLVTNVIKRVKNQESRTKILRQEDVDRGDKEKIRS